MGLAHRRARWEAGRLHWLRAAVAWCPETLVEPWGTRVETRRVRVTTGFLSYELRNGLDNGKPVADAPVGRSPKKRPLAGELLVRREGRRRVPETSGCLGALRASRCSFPRPHRHAKIGFWKRDSARAQRFGAKGGNI